MKPGGEDEEAKGEKIIDPSSWARGKIKVDGSSTGLKTFGPYSSIISPTDGQESAYFQLIQPLYDAFMQGYNCTVFAYGQTGSGKTHTLIGPPKFHQMAEEEWGFCPKVM